MDLYQTQIQGTALERYIKICGEIQSEVEIFNTPLEKEILQEILHIKKVIPAVFESFPRFLSLIDLNNDINNIQSNKPAPDPNSKVCIIL